MILGTISLVLVFSIIEVWGRRDIERNVPVLCRASRISCNVLQCWFVCCNSSL